MFSKTPTGSFESLSLDVFVSFASLLTTRTPSIMKSHQESKKHVEKWQMMQEDWNQILERCFCLSLVSPSNAVRFKEKN